LPKVLAALERAGRHDEAQAIRERAEGLLGPLRARVATRSGPELIPRGTLPAKCPSCGGPVKPDEVNWVGHSSAECPYCGTVIKTV
jgi:hypothetical protein